MRERGHAAVELALAIGVLLLPVAVVVTAFGPWSERRVAAESLAAEASRAVALSLDHSVGDSLVSDTMGELGLSPDLVRVGWCGAEPRPIPSGSCPLQRGSAVSVNIEIWAPLIDTPWGPVGGIWVSASHSEPIDLYRSLG